MRTDRLIGKSAGKICFTNFSDYDFYLNRLIEEASVVWESGRSPWTLLSQDADGATRWLSPDETQVAVLGWGGNIVLETND